jgi:hypothetical protein
VAVAIAVNKQIKSDNFMDSSNDKSLTRLIRAIAAIALLSTTFLIAGAATAQSKIVVTWRKLAEINPQSQYVPSRFLNGFENGEVALFQNGFVIAKNGISLNITKLGERGSLPAIENFPQHLYNSSQLIEIYGFSSISSLLPIFLSDFIKIRPSDRRATLSNGKTAYFIYNSRGKYTARNASGVIHIQSEPPGRQGWCVIHDESDGRSGFTCVNIANSPKSAFAVLNSLPIPNR